MAHLFQICILTLADGDDMLAYYRFYLLLFSSSSQQEVMGIRCLADLRAASQSRFPTKLLLIANLVGPEALGVIWHCLISKIFRSRQLLRIVYILHDQNPHPGEKYLRTLIAQHVMCALADKIIVHSPKRTMVSMYSRKLEFVHLPAWSLVDVVDDSVQLTDCVKKPYLLLFGRYQSYKISSDFIRKFDLYLSYIHSFGLHLIVAGRGWSSFLSRFQLSGVTIFDEYLPHSQAISLISSSIGILLPYSSATQSGVFALADVLSVPVIYTDIYELKEQSMIMNNLISFPCKWGEPRSFPGILQALSGACSNVRLAKDNDSVSVCDARRSSAVRTLRRIVLEELSYVSPRA